jgi:hypothetical protein
MVVAAGRAEVVGSCAPATGVVDDVVEIGPFGGCAAAVKAAGLVA